MQSSAVSCGCWRVFWCLRYTDHRNPGIFPPVSQFYNERYTIVKRMTADVLLINPPDTKSKYKKYFNIRIPPLGILYIAAVLEENGALRRPIVPRERSIIPGSRSAWKRPNRSLSASPPPHP